ncbi:MAG: AzlC family ABC transporter permease [Anaerofustis stercorihominis]|nr:AzlC family ABC transporter permease [Anaerofustis stercorihominis]
MEGRAIMKAGHNDRKNTALKEGIRDGIPIGLGYFAVSFSLGIAARNAGLNAFQGFIASLLTNASAGEYAGFSVIAQDAPYWEMALIILVANARYLLMSCALSQKFRPGTKLIHRLVIGYDITDELFGINIARPGYIEPAYSYGAILVAAPAWATGTALGVIAGNMLPANVVSALSVALFGMFIAIIIPPSKQNKIVGMFVLISFAASYLCGVLPYIKNMSEGTRTIILTVVISAVAAWKFPIKEETEKTDEA